MGASRGDFTKYPRTPHLFGSSGTDDDRHLDEAESNALIADESLIVEEKIDGTNVGIHFGEGGAMVLQCRGHLITEGMHPQYDLFKQWAAVKRNELEAILEDRMILFGEWVYARHSIHYRKLPHYFFEFDLFDKRKGVFLDRERRLNLLEGSNIAGGNRLSGTQFRRAAPTEQASGPLGARVGDPKACGKMRATNLDRMP